MSYFNRDPDSEVGALLAFASLVALGLGLIAMGMLIGD